MSIESARITIDAMSCGDCDCGACLSAAVAAIDAIDGVVYVGFDRRGPAFNVRYYRSTADAAALHEAVRSCGLVIVPTPN